MLERNFIDDMLLEIEAKEKKLESSHADALLIEICSLQAQIENNFIQSREEQQIILDWAIQRNSRLQDRIDWLTKKLEVYMYEQDANVKTIDLPHGQLLRRKQIDKIEITDMDRFMENSNLAQLTNVQPETVVPDKNKIKLFFKMSGKLPLGTTISEGKEKFSIKLKQGDTNGSTSEDGA